MWPLLYRARSKPLVQYLHTGRRGNPGVNPCVWSLYAAVLLVMARRYFASLLLRLVSASDVQEERLQIASVVVLPVLLASFLAPYHRRESEKTLRIFESVQPPSRQLAREMIALQPSLPHGGRVLFVGDPFAKDEHFLLFLTRLLYRDMSITVERLPFTTGVRTGHDSYDVVFIFGLDIGAGILDRQPRRQCPSGRS